jgi:Ca2+-binding EF-hand superfamily protein
MSELLLTSFVLTLQLAAGAGPSTDGQGTSQPARMRFQVMDRNNDGEISRDEWRGSARSFDVHDWNGDGRLSGNEVRIGARQDTNLEEADHNPSRAERYASWTEAGFTSLDHNRDGRITSNEWHYERESFLRADRNRDGALDRAEFLGADMDDDRGDQFDDLDANGNGRVEREEWHASDDAFMWLDRDRDGVLSRIEVTGEAQPTTRSDQFASLDYDGNGTITRNEWHWSLGSFNQRDLNRDGVLSRREFAATADSANSSTTLPRMVRVNSQHSWTDTGIDVRAGDVLTFNARGTVQLSTNPNDVATPAGSRMGRSAPTSVHALAGVLIARIGDSAPMVVGGRSSLTVSGSGRLYLGVNDDHLPDNTGEFEVTVGIQGRAR